MNTDCIFCKIIKGDIPCYKIYEDDHIMAFLDVNPEANGHTLIVPKTHYKDIYDIDTQVLTHILECAKEIANNIVKKLNCDGFTLIQNNGDAQEVKHFHLHIRPYYKETREESTLMEIQKILNN